MLNAVFNGVNNGLLIGVSLVAGILLIGMTGSAIILVCSNRKRKS